MNRKVFKAYLKREMNHARNFGHLGFDFEITDNVLSVYGRMSIGDFISVSVVMNKYVDLPFITIDTISSKCEPHMARKIGKLLVIASGITERWQTEINKQSLD